MSALKLRPYPAFVDEGAYPRHLALVRRGICCAEHTVTGTSVLTDGKVSGARIDMHALRRAFPERWAEFLRRHFRNSAEIAVFFDVDDKCARNWLSGRHAPAGAFVARAAAAFPDAAPCLVEGDC